MSEDSSHERELSCLIVGSGIAGLMAGRELKRQGINVTVLEKARGVGGRMASHRIDAAVFDHGTQYFGPSSPWFQTRISEWIDEGIAREWFRVQAHEMDTRFLSAARYCGHPAMTSIPKAIASSLQVLTNEKVTRLFASDGWWNALTEGGGSHRARSCILTPPVPQSLELLAVSDIALEEATQEALADLVYEPCITVMAVCSKAPGVPGNGVLEFERGNLRRIMDNQRKGVSPDVPAITIHATGAFSATHFGDSDETVARLILDEALPMLRCDALSWQVHRWRYSQILTPHPAPYLLLQAVPPLAIAGDAFGINGVEGAARSGMEAATMILRHLS
jgi:renalase